MTSQMRTFWKQRIQLLQKGYMVIGLVTLQFLLLLGSWERFFFWLISSYYENIAMSTPLKWEFFCKVFQQMLNSMYISPHCRAGDLVQ